MATRRGVTKSARKQDRHPRQRPISCQFCRNRKLRCSRTVPCSNCHSRGVPCRMEVDIPNDHIAGVQRGDGDENENEDGEDEDGRNTRRYRSLDQVSPTQSSQSTDCVGSDIMERLRNLEELVLRQGVQSTTPTYTSMQSHSSSAVSPRLQHLSSDTAWLERVSMGEGTKARWLPGTLVFRTSMIKDIPHLSSRLSESHASLGHVRCVWLPQYSEAKTLLERYVRNASYIHRVVHVPSLPALLDDVYGRIDSRTPISPGKVMLLLSIIACTTFIWTQDDCETNLFSAAVEANMQSDLWITSTLDVLDAAQRTSCLSVELVQGIIIVSFVVCNVEGISWRYRSLISTALMISRELELYRPDRTTKSVVVGPVQTEVTRRIWWYLAATDWLLAARYSGPTAGIYQCHPHHVNVAKPRNINDEDLGDSTAPTFERPLSQPTDMSYFLQRIRLAEIAREIVNRDVSVSPSITGAEQNLRVLDIDSELDRFVREMPSFFSMNEPISSDGKDRASGICIQAYMLNSLVHTQRCKLHLPRLIHSGDDLADSHSRAICIESAKRVIQTELRLEQENHPFVRTRLRLSGILYGLFIASTVLFMDMCVRKGGPHHSFLSHTLKVNADSPQQDDQTSVAASAFRILQDAAERSVTAKRFLDAIVHILRKHGSESLVTRSLAINRVSHLGVIRPSHSSQRDPRGHGPDVSTAPTKEAYQLINGAQRQPLEEEEDHQGDDQGVEANNHDGDSGNDDRQLQETDDDQEEEQHDQSDQASDKSPSSFEQMYSFHEIRRDSSGPNRRAGSSTASMPPSSYTFPSSLNPSQLTSTRFHANKLSPRPPDVSHVGNTWSQGDSQATITWMPATNPAMPSNLHPPSQTKDTRATYFSAPYDGNSSGTGNGIGNGPEDRAMWNSGAWDDAGLADYSWGDLISEIGNSPLF